MHTVLLEEDWRGRVPCNALPPLGTHPEEAGEEVANGLPGLSALENQVRQVPQLPRRMRVRALALALRILIIDPPLIDRPPAHPKPPSGTFKLLQKSFENTARPLYKRALLGGGRRPPSRRVREEGSGSFSNEF